MNQAIKRHLQLGSQLFIWLSMAILGSATYYLSDLPLSQIRMLGEISLMDTNSLISILYLITASVISLGVWYWSGRRKIKRK
ncbi:hypothetical protein [Streptococcus alactolyticus]|uniref:hypothetical protein n=1 Tax=Streptococcus alactolyticus TaxID=29389 RepID=UPI00375301C9